MLHELLKVLPVELPIRQWPVVIATLRNRTLSPIVERFIACAREVTAPLARSSGGRPAKRGQTVDRGRGSGGAEGPA